MSLIMFSRSWSQRSWPQTTFLRKGTFPARAAYHSTICHRTPSVSSIIIYLLIFWSFSLCRSVCLTSMCRQMQKQTDELRKKLQQREDELATSHSNAQVCCIPVLSTVNGSLWLCLYRCVVLYTWVTLIAMLIQVCCTTLHLYWVLSGVLCIYIEYCQRPAMLRKADIVFTGIYLCVCLSLCLSVYLSVQKLKNYWWEIDRTWQEYVVLNSKSV